MAENPFMSAYLGAANRAANTARGKATNEAGRESKRQATGMTNAWLRGVPPGLAAVGYLGRAPAVPPLPAAPAVIAHYTAEAAAEQARIGKWRSAPAAQHTRCAGRRPVGVATRRRRP